MSKKSNSLEQKSDAIQAIIIADSFGSEFLPLSDDVPLALIQVVNKPLIEYTLEFLSLGGVEEVFLFCSTHVDAIKEYIRSSRKQNTVWSQSIKVDIIVSESCQSIGDCLRDLDAKGLLRGNFVLCEPGVVSNIKLLPILKKHIEIASKDKGAAMTLIYQECGIGQYGRCPREEIAIASNFENRVLFHQKINSNDRKINLPLEILLDNTSVSIHHDLKDTHIAICSPSVLPLFSDNFDFQTRDDFIKGLLINEEILGSTIYWHLVKGNQHGGAITNWRMYQAVSQELANRWFYPITPYVSKYSGCFGREVIIGCNCTISEGTAISKSIIGNNVIIGKNVTLENAYIMSDVKIANNCVVSNSIIGPKSTLKSGCKVTFGSVLGAGVVLDKDTFIENTLMRATKPDDFDEADKLGEKAYRLKLTDDELDEDVLGDRLARRFSRMHLDDEYDKSDNDCLETSDSEDELSHVNSPVPDDTNMFFSEVIDSLTRGFEDKLQCDNLILEINSSRYAYNVTLKEVNYNVVKAILNLPFHRSSGQQYLSALLPILGYFSPIFKNYIRNEDAMEDCLQAVEDVAASDNEMGKCIAKVLHWLYDEDHLTEESILHWYKQLDKDNRISATVSPFITWLQEAEEASSEE